MVSMTPRWWPLMAVGIVQQWGHQVCVMCYSICCTISVWYSMGWTHRWVDCATLQYKMIKLLRNTAEIFILSKYTEIQNIVIQASAIWQHSHKAIVMVWTAVCYIRVFCSSSSSSNILQCNTLNGERFAVLNFRVFHSFQEYHESFSVNISASL